MKFSLNQVSVINFRGVKDKVALDFRNVAPGLYFITGNNEAEPKLGSNGAGKSTLFTESLYWALTGKTSRSQRPGSAIENWNISKETTEAVVVFSLDDVEHTITRTRNPNNLDLDGEKVEQQAIDDLLPLTDAALRRSLLIDQFGEMFLSLLPEAKSRIFSDTLDLEKWIRASDNASSEATLVEKELAKSKTILSGLTAASSEARDQYGQSKNLEEAFEETQKDKIKQARAEARTAALQYGEAKKATGIAKEALAAVSGAEVQPALRKVRALQTDLTRTAAITEQRIKSAKMDIQALEKQIKLYSETKVCPQCGQQVTEEHVKEKKDTLLKGLVQREEELKDLEEALIAQKAGLETIPEQIEHLEVGLVEYNKINNAFAIQEQQMFYAERETVRIKKVLDEFIAEQNPFTVQCDKLEERIKTILKDTQTIKARIEGLDRHLDIYMFWRKGFREIRLEQIDAALLELEMATNTYAEELGLAGWNIGFATERETKKGSVSHSFTVSLYPPGQKEPIPWESYSGGESQRWQLATAFGLSEVLLARSGIVTDFEVLDEPTHHLSQEGIDGLLECLSDRAVALNRRIFLIDHHSLERGSFDGIVSVAKTKQRGVYIQDNTVGGLQIGVKKERVKL